MTGQYTALVAEDHPGYRGRIVGLLEASGVRCIAAEDGAEAIDHLQRGTKFDLLVTDLDMPRENGWAVIEAWLASGRAPETIVMVTGEADSRDVQERCAAGGICLVHKLAVGTRFQPAVAAALAHVDASPRPPSVEGG